MPTSRRASRQEPTPYWKSDCGRAVVYVGDCRQVMAQMEAQQFYAVVTDPPYLLHFMSKDWDKTSEELASSDFHPVGQPNYLFHYRWAIEALRVLRPGGHLMSFGGTRTFHRLTCAVEDAGWEVRDTLMWVYSQGFPKSLDVSKAIDKELGAERSQIDQTRWGMSRTDRSEDGSVYGIQHSGNLTSYDAITEEARQWQGWGTALKPAYEPVILARRPLGDTVAQCVLKHGTGGLNVDRCRPAIEAGSNRHNGRWPANLIHDGSEGVVESFPSSNGSAARLFYTAKADASDRPHGRDAIVHPTVKPLDLMQYLVRLVCVRGGKVLDPFMGSGSTGCAAVLEGMCFVGIEQSQDYADLAVGRLKLALEQRAVDTTPAPPGGRTRAVYRSQDTPPQPKKLR